MRKMRQRVNAGTSSFSRQKPLKKNLQTEFALRTRLGGWGYEKNASLHKMPASAEREIGELRKGKKLKVI